MLGLLMAFTVPANAEMVTTDQVLQESGVNEMQLELAQVLQRDDVRAEFESMGVSPEAAQERVARLSDREVVQLHQRVDSLPAGSGVAGLLLVLIILVIIL
jgi:hypothetical protein